MYFPDNLDNLTSIIRDMTYNRTAFLSTFQQRFVIDQPERDVLHEDGHWKRFIPHENSGPCETYDPPVESDPGYEISMHMRMNSSDWDPDLEIFIHAKNNFFYTKKPSDSIYLDSEKLQNNNNKLPHPRAIGNLTI